MMPNYVEVAPSTAFAIVNAGLFLAVGLLSGLWKFAQMWTSPKGEAHPYLDIAHRASLMYGFACITLAVLSKFSVFPSNQNFIAAALAIAFFWLAVGSYLLQAILQGPANQMAQPHRMGRMPMPRGGLMAFMLALVAAELGGALFLLWGALQNPLLQFWSN
ncbi:hypothetical protein [Limnobacter sp.]|uniref:hypothetical protein n=1 Tax=Limnobacter sp. TaxID=2003368 RepID=UPI00351536C0